MSSLLPWIHEGLVRRGMLEPGRVRTYETTALVDTGATQTIVPREVVQRLGLALTDEALVTGDDVLIGQTVLERMDWSVDCRDQRLIQKPRHPDGPIFRV